MKSADDWFNAGVRAIERSFGADHRSELIGDLEEAIEHFDRALALRPDHPQALAQKGLTLARLERHQEADATLAAALLLTRDQASLWLAWAKTLVSLGRYREALAACDETLRLQPDDADACFQRAVILDELRCDAEALVAWQAVLRLPHCRTIHLPLQTVSILTADVLRLRAMLRHAAALDRLGRTAEAQAAYARVFDEAASDLYAPGAPAEFHAALKSSEAARAAYREHLQKSADDPTTWHRAGNAYLGSGRAAEALAAFERLLRLAPEDARAWFGKAEALVQAGRPQEAIAAYRQSLEKEPGFLGASARLAVVLAELARVSPVCAQPSGQWTVMGHDTFAREDFVVGVFDSAEAAAAWIDAREIANQTRQDEALRDTFWIVRHDQRESSSG